MGLLSGLVGVCGFGHTCQLVKVQYDRGREEQVNVLVGYVNTSGSTLNTPVSTPTVTKHLGPGSEGPYTPKSHCMEAKRSTTSFPDPLPEPSWSPNPS